MLSPSLLINKIRLLLFCLIVWGVLLNPKLVIDIVVKNGGCIFDTLFDNLYFYYKILPKFIKKWQEINHFYIFLPKSSFFLAPIIKAMYNVDKFCNYGISFKSKNRHQLKYVFCYSLTLARKLDNGNQNM
ncbi:hypothetical protein BpHYR1_044938 [Brachionus plicatilis]|uniref:Uncharacterized protein n=1 Tax=Brachionus plicatilis TaxID=10195 RepID=A0A3M7S0Q3_BRAPC|nr:hypothetical protein BpHYR1_044938 [Brachionus plicatilis]